MLEHLFLETGFPVHACLLFVIVYFIVEVMDHGQSKDN